MRDGRALKDWPTVTLSDVLELKYGKSLAAASRSGDGFPVYGSNGVVGAHNETVTQGPTIVVGRKGSYGQINYSSSKCWPIDTTFYVDETCTAADLRWLAHLLPTLGLDRMNKSAAVPGLSREDAYRVPILLPPLEEQRRIAAILDKADELRAKRREALARLDTLTRSIFHSMFGDPDLSWPELTVDELADRRKGAIRTGPFGSQLLTSEFTDEGIAVLGIDNAVSNQFAWKERRYISSEKYETLRRYKVRPGDLLVTIMGTVGRCAVVPSDIPPAINTKHLCCITLNREMAVPEWLHSYFLRSDAASQYLRQTTKGAIMGGLNMGILKRMPVLLPPLELQQTFANRVTAVERLKELHRKHLAELDALFASLQHRAFKGEL